MKTAIELSFQRARGDVGYIGFGAVSGHHVVRVLRNKSRPRPETAPTVSP